MDLKINKLVEMTEKEIIEIRRQLHMCPETAFKEFDTARYITHRLEGMEIGFKSGFAKTGVVATINGYEKGDTIAIRADMDALDITELNDVEYKSKTDGKMHACGHDAHVAILLGVGKILNMIKDEFRGTVKLIFQPAEEAAGGALPMIREGVLENPAAGACFALHVDPGLDVGKIEVKDGAAYASPDDFFITIKGKGGHGAMPHLCIDPIVVTAQVITALQNIPSRVNNPIEPCVLSVCSVNGGTATNVIPGEVKLSGTVRTFNEEARANMPAWIENTVKNICWAFGADYDFEFIYRYPPVVNNEKMAKLVHSAAEKVIGENAVWGGAPSMGGEDFAYFAQLVPSCIFKLGCKNEEKGIIHPLHNARFNIDEDCIAVGMKVLLSTVMECLG